MSSRRFHPRAVVVLTAVWLLLWDRPSAFILITGVLLALLIGAIFPLPPIERQGRFRPWAGLVTLVGLSADLVRASGEVVALAFRFGYTPRNSIIKVQLRSRSDVILTQTAELVTLTPGSTVIEARRSTGTLYLHVLDVTDDAGLAAAAQSVLDAEERVVRTFGSDAEVAALDRGEPLPERRGTS